MDVNRRNCIAAIVSDDCFHILCATGKWHFRQYGQDTRIVIISAYFICSYIRHQRISRIAIKIFGYACDRNTCTIKCISQYMQVSTGNEFWINVDGIAVKGCSHLPFSKGGVEDVVPETKVTGYGIEVVII